MTTAEERSGWTPQQWEAYLRGWSNETLGYPGHEESEYFRKGKADAHEASKLR